MAPGLFGHRLETLLFHRVCGHDLIITLLTLWAIRNLVLLISGLNWSNMVSMWYGSVQNCQKTTSTRWSWLVVRLESRPLRSLWRRFSTAKEARHLMQMRPLQGDVHCRYVAFVIIYYFVICYRHLMLDGTQEVENFHFILFTVFVIVSVWNLLSLWLVLSSLGHSNAC